MKKEILRLTKQLVEIPSVTGSEEECLRALELICDYLGDRVKVKKILCERSRNGKLERTWSYLWGDDETLMEPKLLLCGHIDVVPANPSQFESVVSGDLMYGRGMADMKGSVVAMLMAYERMINEQGSKNVGLLLTSDEETGGFDGARYVMESGLKPEVVFIPDGQKPFDVVKSQKAPHHFHIRTNSVGGHVSEAYRLDNPLNRVWKLYTIMRSLYSLATVRDEWNSTFEMTVINTLGASANKLPSEVEAWFSWRWPLEQFSFEKGVSDMQKFAEEFGIEVLPDGHGGGEGCLTDINNEAVQLWMKCAAQVRGNSVGTYNLHGSTDGRHFYKYGSTVIVTAAEGGGAHGDSEWVNLASLEDLAKIIYRYQILLLEQNI